MMRFFADGLLLHTFFSLNKTLPAFNIDIWHCNINERDFNLLKIITNHFLVEMIAPCKHVQPTEGSQEDIAVSLRDHRWKRLWTSTLVLCNFVTTTVISVPSLHKHISLPRTKVTQHTSIWSSITQGNNQGVNALTPSLTHWHTLTVNTALDQSKHTTST